MKLRYKYRIYPTKEQEQKMISVGHNVRFVFNYFLKQNTDKYKLDGKFIWYYDMAELLVQLKKQKVWLNDTYS
jgi:putative transposase